MSVEEEVAQQIKELPIFLHYLTSKWLIKELCDNFRFMIEFPPSVNIDFYSYFGENLIHAIPSKNKNVEDETVGFTILPPLSIIEKLTPYRQELKLTNIEYWISRFTFDGVGRSYVFTQRQNAINHIIEKISSLHENIVIESYDINNIILTKKTLIAKIVTSQNDNFEANLFTSEYSFSLDLFHVNIIF
jgi:hypothetical protein